MTVMSSIDDRVTGAGRYSERRCSDNRCSDSRYSDNRYSDNISVIWQAVSTLNPDLQISAKNCTYLHLNCRYLQLYL